MDESITRKSFMQGAAALAGVAGAGIFGGLANGAHADEAKASRHGTRKPTSSSVAWRCGLCLRS